MIVAIIICLTAIVITAIISDCATSCKRLDRERYKYYNLRLKDEIAKRNNQD